MNNTDKNEQPIPAADNSTLFGTTSSDLVEGLHQNAFPASPTGAPEDDEQIVNEEDQQEIVNPTEEEHTTVREQDVAPLQHVPGIEKDLLDKNVLEESGLTSEEDSDDIIPS